MTLNQSIARLGEIMQLSFVPRDLDATVRYWTKQIGAGPFFLMRNVQVGSPRYRGQPSSLTFDVAIGYWGDIQIELFRQTNDAPSIYKANRDAGNEALHHVCILVDDIEKALRLAADSSGEVVYEGVTLPGNSPFCYIDMKGSPGAPLIEVLQPGDGIRRYFEMMRNAARDWDGTSPLRVVS